MDKATADSFAAIATQLVGLSRRLGAIEGHLHPTEPESAVRCPVWLNSPDVCVHCSLFVGHHGEHHAQGNAIGPLVPHGWRWRQ